MVLDMAIPADGLAVSHIENLSRIIDPANLVVDFEFPHSSATGAAISIPSEDQSPKAAPGPGG